MDCLIVGAGLYGCLFNYLASKVGYKCLIVEKRNHVGGNLYCENIDGIQVHKYGPHIFHTNKKWVWDFVNSITEFKPYQLKTVANYKGEIYSLPFNMLTFNKLWNISSPEDAKRIIDSQLYKGEIHNLEEQALASVGKDIYYKLIKNYTEKQWGKSCKELPVSIIKRIPIRFTYDNNYFNDLYQGIPTYNEFINKLIGNTQVILNEPNWKQYKAKYIIYTGPIDEYFNYSLGKLEWRSLKFETQLLDMYNYQGNAIVNYTDNSPYTRIIEHKFFDTIDIPKTVITKEYPSLEGEPYYPIDETSADDYRELIKREQNVIFGGRLGQYRYYNMDQIIECVYEDFNNWRSRIYRQ